MPLRPSRLVFAFLCSFATAIVPAQTVVRGSRNTTHAAPLTVEEARATRAFNAAKALGAPELYAFLKPMPKGGDLHMHLSGAVYAETFIAEAAKQGLCIAPPPPACTVNAPPDSKATQSPPNDAAKPRTPGCPTQVLDPRLPPMPLSFAQPQPTGGCAFGQLPAADAGKSQPLYDALIDSFSMRGFVPQEGITGHDHFFATFARFGGLKAFNGDWLDEVATRAAAQNEQYLEVMNTPTFTHAASLGAKLGWPNLSDAVFGNAGHKEAFATLRKQLLDAGLRDEVAVDRKEFEAADTSRRRVEGCVAMADSNGLQDLHETMRASGCNVDLRFLYQVLRAFPPQQVFAQTLLAFEVAQAELDSGNPLVVGINFVQPEDAHLAMQDYHLQMFMLDYLHSVYPKVHISLHAGELAFGMVPPDGLTFHIREAVELGHAERIGHGVDVLYETDPNQLLREMADKHVMVEVNPTSNDVILGVHHTDHPLAAYRAAHVPTALSTDDEGVSRIDLTHEYVKAAEEQNLSYVDLKQSARTALEHSFLPGQSLWAAPDRFTQRVGACTGAINAEARPSSACEDFLKTNKRAELQWELERRFAVFEAGTLDGKSRRNPAPRP